MEDPWAASDGGWGSTNSDAWVPATHDTSWSPKLEPAGGETDEWPSAAIDLPTLPVPALAWPREEEEEEEPEEEQEEAVDKEEAPTERSQSPFQADPERPETPEIDEDRPASPIAEGQWGDVELPLPEEQDALPAWEPPSTAHVPVTLEEEETPGDDPWGSARATAAANRTGVYIQAAIIQKIVREARKLTEEECKVNTSEAFAPPKGMAMNMDSLLDPDGELGHITSQLEAPPTAPFDVSASEIHKRFQESLEKTAARSMEILTGSTTRRIHTRLPSLFSQTSIVDIRPYLPQEPVQAEPTQPSFFSSLFTAGPRPNSAGSSKSSAMGALESRGKHQSNASIDSIGHVPDSPGGVKRFFSRWTRKSNDSSDEDTILASQERAVLDAAGLPVAAPAFRDFEDVGNYAAGGLLDMESPSKPSQKQAQRADDLEVFFSAFQGPTTQAPLAAKPALSNFDLLDPLSSSAAHSKYQTPAQLASQPPLDLSTSLPKPPSQAPLPRASHSHTAQAASLSSSPFDLPSVAKPSTEPFRPSSRQPSFEHTKVPFLPPPPPPSSASAKPVNLLADLEDDFGDFSSATTKQQPITPASPPPPPRGASKPMHLGPPASQAAKTNGLSNADLSFFDSL